MFNASENIKLTFNSAAIIAKSYYHNSDDDAKRAIAVACALELINSEAMSPNNNGIYSNVNTLSLFADKIQEALKVNNN
ncbi:hypothetical protein [Photobacterium kishitanii]|uniref:hypothetical protein n=1 Tax=Photobacterium kishitanii TaxID=318456 RepID=UPI0019609824|nr:hypothetical protein [Photobacterium kishitanii]